MIPIEDSNDDIAIRASGHTLVDLGTYGGEWAYAAAINNRGDIAILSYQYDPELSRHVNRGILQKSDGTIVPIAESFDGDVLPYDINGSGQITGVTFDSDGTRRAFVWSEKDGLLNIGTLGGNYSWGEGINNRGQVVGVSHTADGQQNAFIWDRVGGMRSITPPGSSSSYAFKINDGGRVSGYVGTATGTRGFEWSESRGARLLEPVVGTNSSGYGISNTSWVTGYEWAGPTSGRRAVVWRQTGPELLPLPEGWDSSHAWHSNARGQIIGQGGTSEQTLPVLWSDGAIHVLPTLGGTYTETWEINARGEIVGLSLPKGVGGHFTDGAHAVLWRPSHLPPATDLPTPSSVTAVTTKSEETRKIATDMGGKHYPPSDR